MELKQRIDGDLKQAMLAGNKALVSTLRGLKSSILYLEVAKGSRENGLDEAELIDLLGKEAKKRQESADLFEQGGNSSKAQAEREEKKVIESYLPEQLSDEDLSSIVSQLIEELSVSGVQAMGQVINAVKQKTAGQADGGRIASMVKEQLTR